MRPLVVSKLVAFNPPGRWVSLWVDVAMKWFPGCFSSSSVFRLSTLMPCVNTHTEQRQTESWALVAALHPFLLPVQSA